MTELGIWRRSFRVDSTQANIGAMVEGRGKKTDPDCDERTVCSKRHGWRGMGNKSKR